MLWCSNGSTVALIFFLVVVAYIRVKNDGGTPGAGGTYNCTWYDDLCGFVLHVLEVHDHRDVVIIVI